MIYLLDTHALIWSLVDQSKLSDNAIEIIENQKNSILVSAVSFWEISLKYSIGKLDLKGIKPEDLCGYAQQTGFELIPILPNEAANFHNLQSTFHKDPFDRMLVWQAIHRNVTLISIDLNVSKYQSSGLKIIW